MLACSAGMTSAQQPSNGIEQQAREVGQDCHDRLVRISTDTLWYCGVLTEQLTAEIQNEWSASTTNLVISSEGGLSSSAIRLTNFLNSQRATVTLRLACLSACAHIIFVGADNLVVEEGAIVAFHHTATFNYMNYGTEARPFEHEVLERESAAELSYYAERDLDARFLLWPGIATNVSCIGFDPDRPAQQFVVVSQFGWVVPSRAEVENVRNARFAGWWPLSRQDVSNAFARVGGASLTFLSGVRSPNVEIGALTEYVQGLRRCDEGDFMSPGD